MQKPFSYLPLRNHSAYSLLEGAISIDKLLNKAALMGVPALGLCDTANLFGAMEFSLACVKQGIQPVLGCTLRLVVTAVDEAYHASFPSPSLCKMKKATVISAL
jgi:DNA polymerase III subunit alpha